MSSALSSIVRTRQKKTFFPLFFLTLLLFCPLFPPSGVQASESLISSVASPNSVGRAASSEVNIDSFDVHPENRWDESNAGFTAAVSDGLLVISDTGDGSQDSYLLERELRDLSGTIEYRVKVDSNNNDINSEQFLMFLSTSGGLANYIYVGWGEIKSTESCNLIIGYTKAAGGDHGETFVDVLFGDIWYTFRIDYDLLTSELRLRAFFDNGTEVFDFIWQDFSPLRPAIFSQPTLSCYIRTLSKENGKTVFYYVDYVDAPFKEREWTQIDTPGDADWVQDDWGHHEVNDDIDDTSGWSLTVPRLDSVSGSMTIEIDTPGNFGAGEDGNAEFIVYAVDGDDGDLHEAVKINIGTGDVVGTYYTTCAVSLDGGLIFGKTLTTTTNPRLKFVITLAQDRSRITVEGRFFQSRGDTNDPVYYDFVGSEVISNIATVPSQEFVLQTKAACDFDGNVNWKWLVESLSIIVRDMWGDMKPFLEAANEASKAGGNFITDFITWLGSVLRDISAPVTEFLEPLNTWITSVATDVLAGLGDALAFITDAIGTVLSDFITFALNIIGEIWAVIEGTIFFVWDALGLPDIIEIFNLTLAYIIELVQWLVVTIGDVILLAADLSWIILVVWWIWAVPVQWARAGGNPLAGLGNFIEVFFYDLIPWTVFGIHVYVPQGIAATLWMILLLPKTFVLFTALGI